MNTKYLLYYMTTELPTGHIESHMSPTLKDQPIKKKKPRCFYCNKKLKMTELTMNCKCSHTFCLLHLNPHSHNCTFDYLKERRELIEKNNPKMCIQSIEVK
jgi:hypothetical protein